MLRLGIVAHEYPHPGMYGGVARYLEDLVPALTAAGIECSLFAPDVGPMQLDVEVTHPKLDQGGFDGLVRPGGVERQFASWLAVARPNVVHIHHFVGLSMRLPGVLRAASIPYVMHVHDMGLFCNQMHLLRNLHPPPALCGPEQVEAECAACLTRMGGAPSRAEQTVQQWRALGRSAVEMAREVIFVSEAMRELFIKGLGWRPPRHRVLMPALRPPAAGSAAEVSSKSEVTRLAMLGHITPVKGLDLVLDALEMLGEAADELEINAYGELPPLEPFRTQILTRASAQPRITLRGAYSHPDLPAILGEADWLLCPSRFESSSLVVGEAAALGVPAVAARVGGLPERIGDGGILFAPADAEELATALRRCMDADVRKTCRDRLQLPPSVADQAKELVTVYEDAIRTSAAQPSSSGDGPDVTVIMVTFDRLDIFLPRALDSVAAQTLDGSRFEVVLVNDAGPDPTPVVERYRNRLDITVVNHTHNTGIAGCLNTALEHARGRHIAFLADDDLFYPRHLEALLERADSHPAGAVAYSDGLRVWEDESGTDVVRGMPDVPAAFERSLLLVRCSIPAICLMIPRAVFEEVGGFDTSLPAGEDWDMWIRATAARPVERVHEVTTEYRMRSTSRTNHTTRERPKHYEALEVVYGRYPAPNSAVEAARRQHLAESRPLLGQHAFELTVMVVASTNVDELLGTLHSVVQTLGEEGGYEVIIHMPPSEEGSAMAAGLEGDVTVLFGDVDEAEAWAILERKAAGRRVTRLSAGEVLTADRLSTPAQA